MGSNFGILEIVIMAITVLTSLMAFNDQLRFNQLALHVGAVRKSREYSRLLTSGFVHVGWGHLFFNMLTLYFFGGAVEGALGSLYFVLIYVISLVGGNLLAVYINRDNPSYRAVGASGAVSGIMFCHIALFKGTSLGFLILPLEFPAWLFGMGYLAYSIYGIRKKNDGIGHEAHLGGAIFGLIAAMAFHPEVLQYNSLTIALVAIPVIVFILILLIKPDLLSEKPDWYTYTDYKTVDDKYNEERVAKEEELNRILEKMQAHGEESLTDEEKRFLKNFKP
jgi:membrane associated rhomboid family serine protease